MREKILSKIVTFVSLYLLRPNYAKKSFQPIFQYLYGIAISGMNYGLDGEISEQTEIKLLTQVNCLFQQKESVCIFDIGANVGNYAKKVLDNISHPHQTIHCFEPSAHTFAVLYQTHGAKPQFRLNNFGLSDTAGSLKLFKDFEGSGLASLYNRKVFENEALVEMIELKTLDDYCKDNAIEQIDFMKMDVEGNELKVLQGAKEMLAAQRIKMIQFEFGGCNIEAKVFFADIFHLLEDQFDFYRLLKDGFQKMPHYKESYEIFYYANFIAVNKQSYPNF